MMRFLRFGKRRRCIVHVGLHKTASTSIQMSLDRNPKLLKERGYVYPVFQLESDPMVNHSNPLFTMFSGNPGGHHQHIKRGTDVPAAIAAYKKQFHDALTSRYDVVLSGEDASNLDVESLQRMRAALEEYRIDYEVIAYIRSPLSSFASGVQQRIKEGQPATLVRMGLEKRINNLDAAFGDKITYYSFSETCRHPQGPVGFFLNLMGIQDPEVFDLVRANESISTEAAYLINYVNEVEPLLLNGKINPKRAIHDAWPLARVRGSRFKLTSDQVAKIEPILKSENDFLRSRFDETYCDKPVEAATFGSPEEKTYVHFDSGTFADIDRAMPFLSEVFVSLIAKFFQEAPGLSDDQRAVGAYIIDRHSEVPDYLRWSDRKIVDVLRDLAISIETKNLPAAYFLMSLARDGRPMGQKILNKLAEYEASAKQQRSETK